MEWNTIIFNDGSNPYVCKTDREFKKMSKKYKLEYAGSENFWAVKKGEKNETNDF